MLDSQLQAILQSTLKTGFASQGYTTVAVKQNNQPRQIVVPSTPVVYFSGGTRHNYGWPTYKNVWNETTGKFDRTRTQVVHTTFRIGAIAPISPATPNALTSADTAQIANTILQNSDFITSLVAQDCNVFRVTELPAVPFQDSNDQYSWWCSFDIIFTHNDVFVSTVDAITDFKPGIYRV